MRNASLLREEIEKLENELWHVEAQDGADKIQLNGTFGKMSSKWSKIYAPHLLIQTTITGQLSLLMLVEALEEANINVISANTDGITVKVTDNKREDFANIIKRWEQQTKFNMEFVEYASCNFRDVNTYIHVKPDGSTKTKGAYAEAGLMKNPTNEICVEAVINLLTKGVPVEQTIRGSKDITKFVSVRNVKGGGIYDNRYCGKAVRWIYGTDSRGPITYKTNGNKVAKTDGCVPLMDLPAEFPSNVDYGWYISEAKSILQDIGYYKEKFI